MTQPLERLVPEPEPARTGPRGWRPRTALIRGGTERSQFGETCEAVYMTSGYCYESAEQAQLAFKGEVDRHVYSRYANPTVGMFEERMRLLEGAEGARATASGMAAVFAALIANLEAGQRVVTARALFGSCHYILAELLPRYGIETELIDGTDLAAWERALTRPAAAVFFETPSNPTLEIIDMAAVIPLAQKAGARVVVDNVFASPVLQSPFEYGADVVVYSTTKHIDGQGRSLGGVILGDREFCDGRLKDFLRHTGPALSPFNAWLLLKGLETLDMRVERHAANALVIARFLEGLPGIDYVLHPSLASHPQHALAQAQMRAGGNIVAFDLAGGQERAFRFLNALGLVDISNNLGDTKSLITHPATTTHQRLTQEARDELNITPGLVRLSVGLEDVEDVKEDLSQALAVG